jgi:hypothetical protein
MKKWKETKKDKENEHQERQESQMEPNIHIIVRIDNAIGNMNQIIDQFEESYREEDQQEKEQIEKFDEKEINQRNAHQVGITTEPGDDEIESDDSWTK